MPDILIEQAIYGSLDAGGYQFLARSPGFGDDWLAEAQRICTGFGERPAGVACPACVFAQPFGKDKVAVVQAADQGTDDAGRPGALAFRLLVLPEKAYTFLGGDPFFIADRFPPPWHARGELPSLCWPAEPPAPRTVAQLQAMLQRVPEMMPTYLGGVQALIDGGRIVFERPAPDSEVLRCLWMLLPVSTRSRLWPASFAFGNKLGFDALVVPQAKGVEYSGYLPESQAGDYPEGRYELALQMAIESGDQTEVDALFARRSRRDVMKLGLLLLAVVVVMTVVMGLLSPKPSPRPATTALVAAPVPLDLPPPEEYPQLNAEERRLLMPALTALAEKVGVEEPLPETVEELLAAIDDKLGTPDPRRQAGKLGKQGPAQRQLRVLLWKHSVPEYNDVRLNPKELVEKLERRLSITRGDTSSRGR